MCYVPVATKIPVEGQGKLEVFDGVELDYDSSSDLAPRKKCIERRRETSRYAARDRRGKEADVFVGLKEVVPIVEECTATHVDRIAMLRVAATLCSLEQSRSAFGAQAEDVDGCVHESKDETNIWTESSLTECLDGFVLMAAADGTVLYITESVSVFLGLTQANFIGRYLKDFVHQSDYDELSKAIIGSEAGNDCDCGLVLRMKSVISPRGRNLNFKSALYKAIMCKCRFIANAGDGGSQPGTTLNSTIAKGNEAASGMHMTRHTCDMKFTFVSDSLNYLLCHSAKSLMGTSFYDLVHPGDLFTLTNSMKDLFRKGYCRTNFYRLLGSNSSVVWSQTEATTINHTTRGQKGQYVLCVHSILGMQSEADFWCPLNCNLGKDSNDNEAVCEQAAQAVKRNVKAEIFDVAEYFGRQPEFIDCMDFTPLIEPITVAAAMSLPSTIPPARPQIQIANYQDETDFADPNLAGPTLNTLSSQTEFLTDNDQYEVEHQERQPRTRKSSYEEVLQWLFRDEEEEDISNFQNAPPQQQHPMQEVSFPYRRTNGKAQPLQNQMHFYAHTGCSQQPSNSRGVACYAGPGDSTSMSRAGATTICNGSSSRACPVVSEGKHPRRAHSNAGRTGGHHIKNPEKVTGATCNEQEKHHSRYEQHLQHPAESVENNQGNDELRSRSQQHYGPPISTISERTSLLVSTNYSTPPSLQSPLSTANNQIPAFQQRSFPKYSQLFGVQQPVAVVAPFNVNQLPTANTNHLHESIYQHQYINKQNNQPSEFSEVHKPQYYYECEKRKYSSHRQEEDLSKSYKECEQLGAQLAPFLPQEDMFELCDDISLIPMDIEVVAELEQTSEITKQKTICRAILLIDKVKHQYNYSYVEFYTRVNLDDNI
uniref:Uncharacterized protein n=1 Tax=Ditylenchus dipsaci TaxID=166011 RepID=A0A915ECW4_9BILA